MTISKSNSTPHALDDDGTQHSNWNDPSPLRFQDAVDLARRMRTDLRPHTKDRKWRFKSYSECFKATHAIEWAHDNRGADESIAILRLNQLIDYGLLHHVVDPSKKLRVRETRTLYFRIINDEDLDRKEIAMNTACSAAPIINGNIRSSTNFGCDDIIAIEKQLKNIDHILQQTVKELDDARGKLEVTNQQVLELVSQQIYMFGMLLFMYVYLCASWITLSDGMNWTEIGFAATLFLPMIRGYRCITIWSGAGMRTSPIETMIAVQHDDSSVDCSLIETSKSFSRTQATNTLTAFLSKSMRSMSDFKPLRRLSTYGRKSVVIMRDESSLPHVETWQHRPLFICANTPVARNVTTKYGAGSIPLGIPFKFASDVFEGTCLIRIKGSASDNPIDDNGYFSGRKRIFQSVVQGQFKEKVLASDVMTGHEFSRPFRNLPHPFILRTATNFFSKIAPGANICIHTDAPYLEATLMGTSQTVRGDEPGNEPNIACHDIHEDCSVLGGVFTKGGVPASRRKRLFANPDRCRAYMFDTDTVYTFEFYQNLFDAQSYSLDLGFMGIGCSRILNGQPIQWLGKMRDGRYLWSFQIWNESLLPKDRAKLHKE